MPTRNIQGIILSAAPRAELFLRWELFSREGFLSITAPRKVAAPYGPLDTVELVASCRGNGLFLKEVHLLQRPEALSHNLPALNEAARLVNLIRTAFLHLPDYSDIFEIFSRALTCYQGSSSPQTISIKAFYKMLLREGFPVGEGWLNQLPQNDRLSAEQLLKESLQNSTLQAFDTERILLSLIAWSERELSFCAA